MFIFFRTGDDLSSSAPPIVNGYSSPFCYNEFSFDGNTDTNQFCSQTQNGKY